MAAKSWWYRFQPLRALAVLLGVVVLGAVLAGVSGTGFATGRALRSSRQSSVEAGSTKAPYSAGIWQAGGTQTRSRIMQPVDDRVRVTLKGNTHPLARPEYDRGPVADSLPAERMLLILRRAPETEAALRQFLEDVHTPGNANYHKWLRPEQFGVLYGPADSEIATVRGWLEKHGFSVARVTKGKTALEFSGNAGQIREAFGTEIHTYFVGGEDYHANNRDPQIPAALEPVIAGITPMNDFQPASYTKVLGKASFQTQTHTLTPQWTLNAQPVLALAPGDFAVQYDVNPLYAAGVDGSGVTIGIVSFSNLDPAVVATYRSLFGLPAGTLNVIVDGSDPGQNGAIVEAHLDVEIAGAVAPGATINLYTAGSTTVQDGLVLAAQRAVDDDQASVLSTSYGVCEQSLGSAGNQFWAGLWEQAAAQGQTSLVSAGDGGPAGCDDFNALDAAQHGLAVSGFASTPWNVAVGGTDFFYSSYAGTASSQKTELGTYWNLTVAKLPSASLLKPIPEQPWNRPFGLNLFDNGVYNPPPPTIIAGSGGASNCISGTAAPDGSFASCMAGYPKPAWQSGKGVPADGVRDLPDVSLFAAAGENNSAYPICVFPRDCVEVNGGVFLVLAGGTSASSPAMAGMMALVNQKFGAQGQANFVLYPLAAQRPTVFHDITMGSNSVPCQQTSPSCTLSTMKDNTQGFFTLGQFYSAAGYDQATGLGSVDANLLVKNWNAVTFTSTNTTLNLSQTSFTHGTPIGVTASVTGSGGTPSGDIALVTTASPAVNQGLGELTLQAGTASATVNNFPGGQYQVTARYGGDAVFAQSVSSPVTVNVAPENSTVSMSGNSFSPGDITYVPISNGASIPYGTFLAIDAQARGASAPSGSLDGVPTGTVTFTDTASTGNISSAGLNLNGKGLAEWIPATGFPAGTHSVGASYSGDASFNASSSTAPITFTITKATPGIGVFANPKTIGLGTSTTLTAQVATSRVVPAPTGTVTFNFGNTVLGSAQLSPLPIAPSQGQATLSVSSLPLGTDSVTATYNGDADNLAATSSAVNIVVMQNSNLSAVINPPAINIDGSGVITATVPGVGGQATPTGSVGISASGPGASWCCAAATLVNGSANLTLDGSFFNVGDVSVQVGYSGDSIYAPATVTLDVTDAFPFTLGATPVTITAPGATTGNTSTVTVTPVNGYTGAVFLSCALTSSPARAVEPPTCIIPSVNIPGTAAVTATMTINSAAAGSAALVHPIPPGPFRVGPLAGAPAWFAAWAGIAFLLLLGMRVEASYRWRLAGFVLLLAVLGSLAACGGGSGSSGSSGPPPNPGTTPGNYTLTVTGSFASNAGSGTTRSTTVMVTIQ
jgi:trimeric autotransporter adhesin